MDVVAESDDGEKLVLFLLLVKVENLMCFLNGSSNIKHCGLGI